MNNSYRVKDHFFLKAKQEGYKARSVYKLQEIDQKFNVFPKKGNPSLILDLGCAPGSWSQWISKHVPQALIVGVDEKPVTFTQKNTIFLQQNAEQLNLEPIKEFLPSWPPLFDVVVSDMAPATTGIKSVDQARSYHLCQVAIQVAQAYLKGGGNLVIKYFHGQEFEKLRQALLKIFKVTHVYRPKSTRQESKEIFLIGMNRY
ncbi:MAG: RlmE family RNA methyltransferase [Bdellovibrionaceae bacterium]|nr:RlmE family RNA methyltransferase [Pseudobdellovibrionaceae bacterium]MDW8189509.1 RlmE family RNA methyltransferase [Pseudobdellovibrionaceae bacterium]